MFFNLGFLIWSCYKKKKTSDLQEAKNHRESWKTQFHSSDGSALPNSTSFHTVSQKAKVMRNWAMIQSIVSYIYVLYSIFLNFFFVIYELMVWILASMTKDHE